MSVGGRDFVSIVDVLRHHAATRPDHKALIFDDGAGPVAELSYAALMESAARLAGGMAGRSLAGKPVALIFEQGLEFVVALVACLSIGAIAVPVAPQGRRRERLANLLPLLDDCDPAAVVLDAAMARQYEGLASQLAAGRIQYLTFDALTHAPATAVACQPQEEDIAVLQYTSGSTSAPKGIMITHGNLMANQRMIQAAFGHDSHSDFVGWAPHFHDQGLFGNILQPLYLGSTCVLTSPSAFVRRPLAWLEMIDRYRAHTSGGPNFAFDLCVESALKKGLPDIDLSCWKVAFNGAEPIRAGSLTRFAEAFAPIGFRKASLFPCYGLAECTVVTACGPRDSEPTLHAVATDRAKPDAGHDGTSALFDVCSGPVMDEADVVIVDPDKRSPVPRGRPGEIWMAGPHVGKGYWRNAEATLDTFGARLSDGKGPYLRTGDLGYMADEGLYIVGRIKDILIVRGRNYAPSDIEQIWTDVSGLVGQATAAAFELTRHGATHVVLAAEIDRAMRLADDFGAMAARLVAQIRKAGVERLELSISDVVLVAPGGVPRTTSGKVRRAEARRMLEQDLLPVVYASGAFMKDLAV